MFQPREDVWKGVVVQRSFRNSRGMLYETGGTIKTFVAVAKSKHAVL